MSTKTIKRVLNKLERTTKLSAKKLELSAIDLINADKEYIEGGIEYMEKTLIREYQDEFTLYLSQAEESAIDFANEYRELDDLIGQLNGDMNRLESSIENFENLSNELGFDPDSNQDYVDAVARLTRLSELLDSTTVELNDMSEMYNLALNLEQ